MNQDTIPSQLGPMTIPSTLGPVGSPSRKEKDASTLGPAIKWALGAAAVVVLWFLAK